MSEKFIEECRQALLAQRRQDEERSLIQTSKCEDDARKAFEVAFDIKPDRVNGRTVIIGDIELVQEGIYNSFYIESPCAKCEQKIRSISIYNRVQLAAHLEEPKWDHHYCSAERNRYSDFAYPLRFGEGEYAQDGLSKRELFSAMIMANPERYKYIKKQVEAGPDRGGLSQQEASAKNAHKAVLLADALIEELNKPKEQETNGKSKI
jgi:hypothetical protein